MAAQRLSFIDWMKAIGIVLIVFGHLAGGGTINFLTPPFLPKQIGVSCFLFVLGYVLARERRPVWEVVVRRLFVLYVVGIGFAVLLSALSLLGHGRPLLSNYLPFFFGANLLQDNFPANPTTWYIGTYIQIVMLWALVGHRFRVRLWMIPCVATGEIAVRIMLADVAGPWVAYMALSNWITVIFWGAWIGQRADERSASGAEWPGVTTAAILLTALVVVWPIIGARYFAYPFHSMFKVIGTSAPLGITVFASVMVTVLYVGYADCFFRLTRLVPAPIPVRFLARNTLVIFIGHMPVYYALRSILEPRMNYWAAKGIELSICLLGFGFASELLFRAVDMEALRARLFGRYYPGLRHEARPGAIEMLPAAVNEASSDPIRGP